jgi:hypothetical protein
MSGRDRRHGATMVENNGPHIDLQNSASASHQAIKGRVTYFIVVTRACEFGDCRGTGHPRVSRWNSPGAAAATQVASKRPPNPFISPSSRGPSLHQCRRTVGVAPERGIDVQDDHLARRRHISQLGRQGLPSVLYVVTLLCISACIYGAASCRSTVLSIQGSISTRVRLGGLTSTSSACSAMHSEPWLSPDSTTTNTDDCLGISISNAPRHGKQSFMLPSRLLYLPKTLPFSPPGRGPT